MKYKYRVGLYVLNMMTAELSVVLMFLIIGLVTNEPIATIYRVLMSILPFLFVMCFMFMGEYKNRYVETFDDYMHLNSFRFKGWRHPRSLNVKYEDMWYIEAKCLPLIGVWAIRINAKFLPHKVTISYCFKNSSQLYAELCEKARLFKPDVYIDDRLTEYLNK